MQLTESARPAPSSADKAKQLRLPRGVSTTLDAGQTGRVPFARSRNLNLAVCKRLLILGQSVHLTAGKAPNKRAAPAFPQRSIQEPGFLPRGRILGS